MKFENYLIVTDIDGTYLNHQSDPVPKNTEAIRMFCENGGKFTFSSGRISADLDKVLGYTDTLANVPALLCNGSYMYDIHTQQKEYINSLDASFLMDALINLFQTFPSLGARIPSSFGYWVIGMNEFIWGETKSDIYEIEHTDFSSIPEKMWEKVVIFGPENDIRAAKEMLHQRFADTLSCTNSAPILLEVLHPACSKASGIAYYKKNYPNHTIVACGDFENDLPMLKAADLSVCPSNAHPDVKNICDLCLCSNNEGLIAAVISYIENNLKF